MRYYTIWDLSRESGVSVRVIRGYRERGLLPPARRGGHNGDQSLQWTQEHLDILLQIQEIRDNNMTLADIHDRLYPEVEDGD